MSKKFFLLVSLALFSLTACGVDEEPSQDEVVNQIYTSVAQTVAAMPTETVLPTATSVPPTARLIASPLPASGNAGGNGQGGGAGRGSGAGFATPTYSSVVLDQAVCKDALFMSDITIPDGTILAPGESFEKIWLLYNGGTCEWQADYTLRFVSGEEMSGIPLAVGIVVPPNGQAQLSVSMTAPFEAGTYTGYWQMSDSEGINFGNVIFVEISVSNDLIPTATIVPTETYTPELTATETPVPTETPIPPTETTIP